MPSRRRPAAASARTPRSRSPGIRGREAEATELIDGVITQATAGGQGTAVQYAHWANSILMNGLGRYEEALAAAVEASEDTPELFIASWALSELIEAATRTENAELARGALARLAEHTEASDTDWALGIHARSRALLSDGEAAERLYREAIDRLGRTRLRPDLARAHLLYGEWLRRDGRRKDAREQLRRAHESFVTIGMEAFAERAQGELLATGEKVRTRTAETRDELTPQERQIARLARDGLSNPEIGARLFLSPRTVEWHLRKVFAKLGIHSRHELANALPGVRVRARPGLSRHAPERPVSRPVTHGRDAQTRRAGLTASPESNRVSVLQGDPLIGRQATASPARSRSRFPRTQLAELRRRIEATRWPSEELVADRSQGVQLATLQALARYWTTEYDWRTCEARLNALPQFTTEIDGVEIHFIHVRSRHENALPLIMTHGWPGSVIELLDTVGPLTDPTAHGGTPEDAFHLVLPSLPGYGFSGEPTELGWESGRIARAWAELMDRLGYTRYVAQGGDVGANVTDAMGRQGTRGAGRHPRQPAQRGARHQGPAAGGVRAGTRGARGGQHVHDGRLRLLPGAVHPAADDRLLAAGLTRRAGGLDARPRHGQLLQDLPRVRRRRARGQSHPGRPSSTTSRCTG